MSAIRRLFFFGSVMTSVPSDHFAVEASPSIESENANELSSVPPSLSGYVHREPLARDFGLDLCGIDADRRDSHFVTIGMVDHLGAFELKAGRSALPSIDQHFVEELVEGALEVRNQSATGSHRVSVSHDFAPIVMQRHHAGRVRAHASIVPCHDRTRGVMVSVCQPSQKLSPPPTSPKTRTSR